MNEFLFFVIATNYVLEPIFKIPEASNLRLQTAGDEYTLLTARKARAIIADTVSIMCCKWFPAYKMTSDF